MCSKLCSCGNEDTELPSLPDSKTSQPFTSDDTASYYERNGPLVINADGTLSRITNWNVMTPKEREQAKEYITKRNKVRMDKLKEEAEVPLDSSGPDYVAYTSCNDGPEK